MKSIKELLEIKEKMQGSNTIRENSEDKIKVVIGMGTCGIASGAREIMRAFLDSIALNKLTNVVVTQMGCKGMCSNEPMVDVIIPGKPVVSYVNLEPSAIDIIVKQHIIGGDIVAQYTLR